MSAAFEKLVVVTRKTRLEELTQRFVTRAQARFYIEHAGGDFAEYEQEHAAYGRSLDTVRRALARDRTGLKWQELDRSLIATYLFAPTDLVVTVGQDGLVANVAKYTGAQPIVAVNPDPARFDGVLLPWTPASVHVAVERTLAARAVVREVTLAQAQLADGQRLLAFNELFVGARTHVSARYRIRAGKAEEAQSSSGVLVSTGAGTTGWMSSVFNMARGVSRFAATLGSQHAGGSASIPDLRLGWEDPRLLFAVREPFASKHSSASLIAGFVAPEEELVIESLMPTGGVIFSDGVESDFLTFDSGAVARVRAAAQRARLIVPALRGAATVRRRVVKEPRS